jgi:hypothetical protein
MKLRSGRNWPKPTPEIRPIVNVQGRFIQDTRGRFRRPRTQRISGSEGSEISGEGKRIAYPYHPDHFLIQTQDGPPLRSGIQVGNASTKQTPALQTENYV